MGLNLELHDPYVSGKGFFKEPLVVTFLSVMLIGLALLAWVWFGPCGLDLWVQVVLVVYLVFSVSQTGLVLGMLAYLAYLGSYFLSGDLENGGSVFGGANVMRGRLDELRRRERALYTTAKQVFAWREALKKHIREYGGELCDSYTGWAPWIVPDTKAMPVFPKRSEKLN